MAAADKKTSYVLSENQISLFDEAENSQDHKAEEITAEIFTVKAPARKSQLPIGRGFFHITFRKPGKF